ncbi:monovalent cation/H+ antiporter complex subunit F [Alphaproteobacteria bacterium]|jgi:multicomponent Na+:H+ antiporter subunit F|nr:pH regulation protein F [Rhodobiaceae bacterium]MBL6641839.1 pH regulation protein F [PS1 clade bacterium]MCH1486009.1 monovalent cation/H+ antiporter complex subunit F [Alphaproteobacteria bacterium]RPF95724.1 MAG: pH regulation protein F [Rhizobiales bacterium TMED162]MBL6783446.1 pH regulation protein F [PS1 clade bacterium]|tara:strand:- start:214 stop:510 length:297 start_codon:yes stop_codon:yes gene_type:complete
MEIALAMTLIALGIAATLAIIRATLGPTSFDRVLAVNAVGSIAVLLIAVYGFFDGRPAFLDIAMLYALINFIGTIAILKFFRFGTLGDHVLHEDEEDA